jgi:hypothetical protein
LDDDCEIPLTGGRTASAIVRVGDTVRKPSGPWTPAVHDLLRHVEDHGFTGAPRALGIDERGREVLTYIHGDTLATPQDPDLPPEVGRWPETWQRDEALVAAAKLLRSFHDVAASFTSDADRWRYCHRRQAPPEIVVHGDIAPWNSVYRDGLPVAFIDWDSARPEDPLVEVGDAA